MTKALKTRQICFFYIAILPVVKFFMMPSYLSGICGEDLWISVFINCLADIITVAVLYLCFKNRDGDFFTLSERAFGKVFAKIVAALYIVFFLLKAVIPLHEEKNYVELTLYVTSPNLTTFMPVFAAVFFISLKRLRVIGRIADAIFIIALIGYAFTFALAIPHTDPAAILPVGAHGAGKVFDGAYSSYVWFSDGAYFLFFAGNFVKSKRDGLKIAFSMTLSALIVLFFVIIFYGTFTSIAFRQRFALTEISKYTTAINNMERFDYIPIFALLFVSLFSLSMPFYFAAELLSRFFRVKQWIAAIAVCVPSVLLLLFFDGYFNSIENFILNIANGYFLFFGCAFPIIISVAIALRGKKEIQNEVYGN